MVFQRQNPVKNLELDNWQKVDVWTEKTAQNQHRISAKVKIPYPSGQIWQVLTDYEALPEFIPHLVKSQFLSHPEAGIRLEQVGTKCPLHFCFSARVVLDLVEEFPHQIQFQMVEGDFKAFAGVWRLTAQEEFTELAYSLQVIPKITMPIALLKKQLYQDLPVNLLAISQRVREKFVENQSCSRLDVTETV